MLWFDKIAESVTGIQIVNDSKTPSGPVHVGALRGVLLHNVLYQALSGRGLETTYLYGFDDMDPLDELPASIGQAYVDYLGRPLCDIPAPPGSSAQDLAEHYATEFLGVFARLDVAPRIYRTRDLYRSGLLNQEIDTILRNGPTVRLIYREVSGAERPEGWLPFQVVCRRCAKIGTTIASDYDGTTLSYFCSPTAVAWAEGCGLQDRVSPFNGAGKLPWKLEWAAKWQHFGVTVEGAGKDHSTRGGARDVSEAVSRRVLQREPPLNVPYEFFLVGGRKMSSSRGVGVTATNVGALLPPTVLRFLILSRQPSQQVNFTPDRNTIYNLYSSFDTMRRKAASDPPDLDARRLLTLCGLQNVDLYLPDFQLLVALVQIPAVNIHAELEKRKGSRLSIEERLEAEARIASARQWLESFAAAEDRFEVLAEPPSEADQLSNVQRAFLHRLAASLVDVPWEDAVLHATVFAAARNTPLENGEAFLALYWVLLGRQSGPRAGSLLSVLDRTFVSERLRHFGYSEERLWFETAKPVPEVEAYLTAQAAEIDLVQVTPRLSLADFQLADDSDGQRMAAGFGVLDLQIHRREGHPSLLRCLFSIIRGFDIDPVAIQSEFQSEAAEWVEEQKRVTRIKFATMGFG